VDGPVDVCRRLSVHVDEARVTRAVDGAQQAADLARVSMCHHKKGKGHRRSLPHICEQL